MKIFKSLNLILVLLIVLTACGQKSLSWQEQYDLGVHYLSEGNYEEAVIAFTAAIEIDPMKVDTYLELAQIYLEQGNVEAALEILNQGLSVVSSDELEALKQKIEGQPAQNGKGYSLSIKNETPQWGVLKVYHLRETDTGEFKRDREVVSGERILPEDNYLSFDVENIAEGYRIGSFLWNGEEWGNHLAYGGYGHLGRRIKEDTELVFSMEPIPDELPQIGTVYIGESTNEQQGRVLDAILEGNEAPEDLIDYTWEYREMDSTEWTRIWFWENYSFCPVAPYGGQEVDLTGKYVRVTISGKERHSQGEYTSAEYFVDG